MIPIGLLRGTLLDMNVGHQQNRSPYVYTNPKKSTIVYKCDKVFVLSMTPLKPSDKLNIKVSDAVHPLKRFASHDHRVVIVYQEWLLNLQMQNKGGNSIPGAEETAADLEKRRRAEQVDLLQRQFDARIDKVSHQINKQMNALITLLEHCLLNAKVDEVTPSTTRRGSVESGISNYTAVSSEQVKQRLKDHNMEENVDIIDSQQPFKLDTSSRVISEGVEKFEDLELDSSTSADHRDVVYSDGHATFESPIGSPEELLHRGATSSGGATSSRPKVTPLRHLMKDYENITGPSIKFATPITEKRIERIRSLAAERTRSAPPKMYKILPKLMNKVKQENIRRKKARESHVSTEAVYYEGLGRSQSSDEHSLSDMSVAEVEYIH